MDYLSHNIAVNLKRIRTSKGMSLDVVAEQTGVSKSMLATIEKGDKVVSIIPTYQQHYSIPESIGANVEKIFDICKLKSDKFSQKSSGDFYLNQIIIFGDTPGKGL